MLASSISSVSRGEERRWRQYMSGFNLYGYLKAYYFLEWSIKSWKKRWYQSWYSLFFFFFNSVLETWHNSPFIYKHSNITIYSLNDLQTKWHNLCVNVCKVYWSTSAKKEWSCEGSLLGDVNLCTTDWTELWSILVSHTVDKTTFCVMLLFFFSGPSILSPEFKLCVFKVYCPSIQNYHHLLVYLFQWLPLKPVFPHSLMHVTIYCLRRFTFVEIKILFRYFSQNVFLLKLLPLTFSPFLYVNFFKENNKCRGFF